MAEGIPQLGQREVLVEHRLDAGRIDSRDHVELLLTAADGQSDDAQLLGHECGGHNRPRKASENADQRDVTHGFGGNHRLVKRPGAADFDNMIGRIENFNNSSGLAFLCSRQYYWQVMRRLDNATSQFRELSGQGQEVEMGMFKGWPVIFSPVMPTATATTSSPTRQWCVARSC